MSWLFIVIFAYFLFAICALIDKYLLSGQIPSPKIYSFYVGMLGIFALILIPFGFLEIPEISLIFLAILAGAFRILAIFAYFTALQNFETSRVVPVIGGILPLFTLGLTYFFIPLGTEIFTIWEFLAFILLITGSVFITFEKKKLVTLKSLQLSSLAAFLFALSFLLFKLVYLTQPFLSGFIWILIGSAIFSLFFLLSKEVKEELFKKKFTFKTKTAGIFLSNQALGGSALFLQNFTISIVPITSLAFINALEGTKYVFLLIFVTLLSLTQPIFAKRAGLKEEISRKVLFQKIISILLIGGGLIILTLK